MWGPEWPCRNEQRTNRLLLIGGEIGVGSSLFIKNQDPGRTRALHCLGRKRLSNPERKLWRFMASPRIQQSMWAFVILAQIASHWSHFNQSEPGLVFSDDAGGFTAGDDNGIAAASKKASDESKHFHGGRRNYSTKRGRQNFDALCDWPIPRSYGFSSFLIAAHIKRQSRYSGTPTSARITGQ